MAARTTTKKDADPFGTDNKDNKNVTDTDTNATSNNSGVTFSHKPTIAYDSPLLVFKAPTPSELLNLYKDTATKDVIEKSAEVDAWIKTEFAKHAPEKPAATTGGSTPPAAASGGSGKSCRHGEMQFKSGSKNGKTWSGWFCPTPRGTPDQCAPEFVR